MHAETFIALDRYIETELGLATDGEPIATLDGTFVIWRGFHALGPLEVTLQLAPSFDAMTTTLYADEQIEEVAVEYRTGHPSIEWLRGRVELMLDTRGVAAKAGA